MICTLIMAAGLLAGCGGNGDDAASPASVQPTSKASSPAASPSGTSSPAASPSEASSPAASQTEGVRPSADLPETKNFTLPMEGNEEVRTAKLARGDGYALYVFEQFSLDAQANRLTMNVDRDYYVDIRKLPAGYKLEDVKKDAEKELAEVGETKSMEGADINPLLGGAALFLIASGDKLTREVIVKEVDGVGYLFNVNMPQGEPSEGFGPLAFASMSSIANL